MNKLKLLRVFFYIKATVMEEILLLSEQFLLQHPMFMQLS